MPHVCFILHPQFQMLAYVLASETLRIANRRAGHPVFTWETRTATSAPTLASNGRSVVPDVTGWGDTMSPDLVLVIAGYDPLALRPPGLAAFLRRAERSGAVLGGVDTGVWILAAFGLLRTGQRVVLHREAEAGFREVWPEVELSDGIYVLEDKRLSAAGGTATGDVILAWIADCMSQSFAEEVAEDMAHGTMRPSEHRQRFREPTDTTLDAMRREMVRHIQHPVPVSDIAAQLKLSSKQLRARCMRAVGKTPSQYFLDLRLTAARDLLRSTTMPVTQIALATGFGSHAGFSRAFRQVFGITPSQMRQAAVVRGMGLEPGRAVP
ncbi:MAG: helix-turn-helix domain-containing protein [Limimaricola sp.]|nr:helix-turn-helix domain-containing protein [Limimaricola sp.]